MTSCIGKVLSHAFRPAGADQAQPDDLHGKVCVDGQGKLSIGDRQVEILQDPKFVRRVTARSDKVVVYVQDDHNEGTHVFDCKNSKDAKDLCKGFLAGPQRDGTFTTRNIDVHDQLAVQTVANYGNKVSIAKYGTFKNEHDVALRGHEGNTVNFSKCKVNAGDYVWGASEGGLTLNCLASGKLGDAGTRFATNVDCATTIRNHGNVLIAKAGKQIVAFDGRTDAPIVVTKDVKLAGATHAVMCSDEDSVYLTFKYGVVRFENFSKYIEPSRKLAYQAPTQKLNVPSWYDGVIKIDVHGGKLLFVANPPAWVRVDIAPTSWSASGNPGEGAVLGMPEEGFGPTVVDGKLMEDIDDPDNLMAVLVDSCGRTGVWDLSAPQRPLMVSHDDITSIGVDPMNRTEAVGAVKGRGLCALDFAFEEFDLGSDTD